MSSDWKLLAPASQANKYTRGKLIVVAGSARYPGAAVLAARASQRMGAGYTEVVTAKKAVGAVRASSPSLVVRAFSKWQVKEIPASSPDKPCAVCIGPGFEGTEDEAELVKNVLGASRCPVLIDGGGLRYLGANKVMKRLRVRASDGYPTVITPHGGEAAHLARVFGISASDPMRMAPGLAYALHSTVVLKGPDTYISDGKRTFAVADGTAALAKAGTGDVLAGMISSALAQGIDAVEAARLGVTIHARAGVLAADELTDICVVAEDIIDYVPHVLVQMRNSARA